MTFSKKPGLNSSSHPIGLSIWCAGWASSLPIARTVRAKWKNAFRFLQPRLLLLPEDVSVPYGIDRQYSALSFCVGRIRLSLLLLFPEEAVPSPERLREIALLTGYCVSFGIASEAKAVRDIDLTERELECLFWIAEGKTSDEIAMILGISRNTINNYITSVMRKTATKPARRQLPTPCATTSYDGRTDGTDERQ